MDPCKAGPGPAKSQGLGCCPGSLLEGLRGGGKPVLDTLTPSWPVLCVTYLSVLGVSLPAPSAAPGTLMVREASPLLCCWLCPSLHLGVEGVRPGPVPYRMGGRWE